MDSRGHENSRGRGSPSASWCSGCTAAASIRRMPRSESCASACGKPRHAGIARRGARRRPTTSVRARTVASTACGTDCARQTWIRSPISSALRVRSQPSAIVRRAASPWASARPRSRRHARAQPRSKSWLRPASKSSRIVVTRPRTAARASDRRRAPRSPRTRRAAPPRSWPRADSTTCDPQPTRASRRRSRAGPSPAAAST